MSLRRRLRMKSKLPSYEVWWRIRYFLFTRLYQAVIVQDCSILFSFDGSSIPLCFIVKYRRCSLYRRFVEESEPGGASSIVRHLVLARWKVRYMNYRFSHFDLPQTRISSSWRWLWAVLSHAEGIVQAEGNFIRWTKCKQYWSIDSFFLLIDSNYANSIMNRECLSIIF